MLLTSSTLAVLALPPPSEASVRPSQFPLSRSHYVIAVVEDKVNGFARSPGRNSAFCRHCPLVALESSYLSRWSRFEEAVYDDWKLRLLLFSLWRHFL